MSRIVHIDQMTPYEPPLHAGTKNVRLVEAAEDSGFEMVLGRVEPGGVAHRHFHDASYQAMYVTGGRCEVELGDEPVQICGPGTIVRIPPGLEHKVTSLGPEPLEVVLVYSPPVSTSSGFLES